MNQVLLKALIIKALALALTLQSLMLSSNTLGGVSLDTATTTSTITSQLVGKDFKTQENIKAAAIVKNNFVGTFTSGIYTVQITQVDQIEGGVQIFARAWKNGKQLGFGSDGTVDIERFRMINSPILVADTLGNIVVTEKDIDGTVSSKTYREDTLVSTQNQLVDTIRIVGKDGANIVPGKIGHTTATVFGVAAALGTIEGTNNASYTTIHDGATGQAAYTSGVNTQNEVFGGSYLIMRAPLIFDTSTVPSGSTVSSAVYSITPTGSTRSGDGSSATIVSFTGSASAITVNDFDKTKWGTTSGGATAMSSLTSGAYRDITLNATGIGYLTLGGTSKIGLRDSGDIAGNVPSGLGARLASSEGGGFPSKLVITYTAPVASPPAQDIISFDE